MGTQRKPAPNPKPRIGAVGPTVGPRVSPNPSCGSMSCQVPGIHQHLRPPRRRGAAAGRVPGLREDGAPADRRGCFFVSVFGSDNLASCTVCCASRLSLDRFLCIMSFLHSADGQAGQRKVQQVSVTDMPIRQEGLLAPKAGTRDSLFCH